MLDFTDAKWVEAWIEYVYYDYVLLLYGFADDTFKIYDPQEKSLVNEIFHSYDEACFWLGEDEFTKIDARYLINDSE
ncbi:MAG: hypothetical protein DPW16_10435 [Chloroflexi bacterium]|nr:hypothetical protein [Chloroflexota bacterium]